MIRHQLALVFAVALTVAAPRIAAAQAATPAAGSHVGNKVGVKLLSGTIVVGTVVSEDADAIVIDAGPLGKITIKNADIAGRVDPALVEAVGAPAPPPTAPAPNTGTVFAAPGQVRWTRSLDVQGSFNSAIYEQGQVVGIDATGKQLGLTGDQYTTNLSLAIARSTNRDLMYLNGAYNLAVYEPQGAVMRMPTVSFGYSHQNKDDARYFYTARYEWYRDVIRHINKSHQAFVGLGVHAVNDSKVQIDVVPMVGALLEEKGTEFDNDLLTGFGFVWQLTYKPNPIINIEHRENFHAAFTDFDYRGLESYVGFRGMVSTKLGLTIGLTHMYDKALEKTYFEIPQLPGVRVFANKASYIKLTTGLHIGF